MAPVSLRVPKVVIVSQPKIPRMRLNRVTAVARDANVGYNSDSKLKVLV